MHTLLIFLPVRTTAGNEPMRRDDDDDDDDDDVSDAVFK